MHRRPRLAPWVPRLSPNVGCEFSLWMTRWFIFISLLLSAVPEPSLLTGWGARTELGESKLIELYRPQKPFCTHGAEIPHSWESLTCMLSLEVACMSAAASIPYPDKRTGPFLSLQQKFFLKSPQSQGTSWSWHPTPSVPFSFSPHVWVALYPTHTICYYILL